MPTPNHVLASLTAEDRARLDGHLEPVDLPLRKVLEIPNTKIKYVYFPQDGMVSVVALAGKRRKAEVGIIGRDGLTGHAVIIGDGSSPNSVYMQLPGHGVRIVAADLISAMDKSRTLQKALHRFIAAFAIQASYTALANSQANIEERLARWLLMAHDRIDGNLLAITHEFLSLMLGVRRPGVTEAIHSLTLRGLVKTRRSVIEITDREGLRAFAAEIYGVPEAELLRLTGWRPESHTSC